MIEMLQRLYKVSKIYIVSIYAQYKLIIIYVAIIIVLFLSIKHIFYLLTTDVFYYQHKDFPNEIIQERRQIKKIENESYTQAMIRIYLSGSIYYTGKMPFSYDIKVISISHGRDNKILILNWNNYFLRDINQRIVTRDIELLLKTIKRNSNIGKVYFLIENNKFPILWKGKKLEYGILLKEI